MARKYEVFIEGRVLSIQATVDPRQLEGNWLALQVDAAEELPALITMLESGAVSGGVALMGEVELIWSWFRALYVPVPAAGGAVTDEQGRLLAIHRLGRWDLPKGKVEPGEVMADAAVREVQEECGLEQVERGALLATTWHTYHRNGVRHLKGTEWYLMSASSTAALRPQLEEDIDRVEWLDRAGVEALRAGTYPSLLQVVNAWVAAVHGAV